MHPYHLFHLYRTKFKSRTRSSCKRKKGVILTPNLSLQEAIETTKYWSCIVLLCNSISLITHSSPPLIYKMQGKHPSKNSYLAILVTLTATLIYREFFSTVLGPIVETSNGKVQSILSKSRKGTVYYEFLGIPYATPPIAELRFEVRFHNFKFHFGNFSIRILKFFYLS